MTHLEQKNDGLEIKKRRKEGRKRKILLHENLDFSRMDSSVTFRASSGRGESLRPPRSGHTRKITLEIKFEKPILNFEVRPMHEELATFRTFNFDQFPTFILRRPIRNSGEFYVNLRARTISTRSLPCIVEKKKKRRSVNISLSMSHERFREISYRSRTMIRVKKKKEKKETIISFKFN